MADARILLHRAADGSARLLLGSQAGGGGAAQLQLQLSGSAGLGGLACALRLRVLLQVSGAPGLSGLACTGALRYQSQAQRPTVGAAAQGWQSARASAAPLQAAHHTSRAQPAGSASAWQRAQALGQLLRQLLPPVLAPLPLARRSAHCRALPQHSASRWRHDAALRQDVPQQTPWQRALAQQLAVLFLQQDGLRQHLRTRSAWQCARPWALPAAGPWQGAHAAPVPCAGRWQRAHPPAPGRWQRPAPPTPEPPCFDPARARIVLLRLSDGGAKIVVLCQRQGPGPQEPGAAVVVPVRRVYMVVNHITLQRVDSGAPLHALSFSAALDADSWTWQWSASLHESAGEHLARQANGDPPEVLATINGQSLRLVIERVQLNQQFLPQKRFNVSGRGRAAILAAPWAPVLQHGPNAARTAQQLAQEALQINGVGIGWAVDWQTEDWPVPANAWAMQGSYIDALLDIAQAGGAYVQPHPTDATVRILPRYPAPPWDWAGLAPDYQIPTDAAQTLGTEFVDKPKYNRVFVGGTAAGVFGPITRSGTAGEVLAPQVTHPLITSPIPQRLRALSVLADTGAQKRVSLAMQVLPATGIIPPGKLVRVGSGAAAMLGLVRGVQLQCDGPRLRQTLELEVHA